MTAHDNNSIAANTARISTLDVLRGIAVIAMTIFHFSWDLESFGYAPAGMTTAFGWKLFARSIASSFLFIAGFSLFLSHGAGIRWPSFWKRFAKIAAAAAIITIGTYFATPERFIFFGILHQLAFGSLIAIFFVRLPWAISLLAAILIFTANHYLRTPFLDHPAFWWSGLGSIDPPANDFVPIFPWTAALLLGVAVAKALSKEAVAKIASINAVGSTFGKALAWLGKHSLPYYLIHQLVLVGLVWSLAQIAPPDRSAAYVPACVTSCAQTRDAKFCESFCSCVKTSMETKGIFNEVLDGKRNVATDPDVATIADQCTMNADGS